MTVEAVPIENIVRQHFIPAGLTFVYMPLTRLAADNGLWLKRDHFPHLQRKTTHCGSFQFFPSHLSFGGQPLCLPLQLPQIITQLSQTPASQICPVIP